MNEFAAVECGLFGVTAAPYLIFLGLYAWVRPKGSPASKWLAEPTVSVFLSIHDEQRMIEGKLNDVFELDLPMAKAESSVGNVSTNKTSFGSARIWFCYPSGDL